MAMCRYKKRFRKIKDNSKVGYLKKKKEILIVGGTGFIGYHLASKCTKIGWNVTSIATRKPKKMRFLKEVKYLKCDISQKNKLKKKIKKNFNYVVNLGGYVDHSNDKKTYRSHYLGLKNLSSIFLNKSIEAFLQIGSSGEYQGCKSPHIEYFKGKPKSIYYKSKLLSSLHLKKLFTTYKFPVSILRLYQVYGPKQDCNRFLPIIINSCIKDKKFLCSAGIQFRDFIYIDDLINAILKTLKSTKTRGEIINIGSNKPLKIKNIIQYINKKIKKGHPVYGGIKLRKDEDLKTFPNIKKAKKLINWKPKTPFLIGLKKTIKYYNDQKNN